MCSWVMDSSSASLVSMLSMPSAFHNFGSQILYPVPGPLVSRSSPSLSSTNFSALGPSNLR